MSPHPIEVGPPPGNATQDESTVRGVDNPAVVIAGLTHCGKRAAHLRYLIDHFGVPALVGLDLESLLAHVRESPSARGDVVLASL